MKIAIIGAGFFSYHIAHEIKTQYPSAKVEIFEREVQPLLGAGSTNQCRLHMGFHYPRSRDTIYQSIIGFSQFENKYSEFVKNINNNLYAVHRDGLVSASQYLSMMDSFSLPYEKVAIDRELFSRPDEISLVLRVPEKSIDVSLLRSELYKRFTGALHTSVEIVAINSQSGILKSSSEAFGPFDYIINATYTNLNLGLPDEKKFIVQYELAAMMLCRTSLPVDSAVTIMDGKFISVYPAYNGMHILSSVVKTPFRRYMTIEELQRDYPIRHKLALESDIITNIGAHVQQHLNIIFETEHLLVTAKTKLYKENGDSRASKVRRHERLFAVLCGKLGSVFCVTNLILKELKS